MAISSVKFTGENYFTAAHVAGVDIYHRSASASDAGTVSHSGVQTVSGVLDLEAIARTASQGLIEVSTGYTWDTLPFVSFSAARVGNTTFYDFGTAAEGTIHVHSQPSDGDTLEIGLTGFTDTPEFKTTLDSYGQIKIGADTEETADNIASYINDVSTGPSTPVADTDWSVNGLSPADANAFLSATVSGNDVTLTDRIGCARQLAWVSTASNTASLSVNAINGGIDGLELGTVAAGNSSISTSASEGIILDTEDLAASTLPPGFTGYSAAVATRGKFVLNCYSDGMDASVLARIQISNDGTTWNDAPDTTFVIDEFVNQFTGDDFFAEYARIHITANTEPAAEPLNMKIIYQSR